MNKLKKAAIVTACVVAVIIVGVPLFKKQIIRNYQEEQLYASVDRAINYYHEYENTEEEYELEKVVSELHLCYMLLHEMESQGDKELFSSEVAMTENVLQEYKGEAEGLEQLEKGLSYLKEDIYSDTGYSMLLEFVNDNTQGETQATNDTTIDTSIRIGTYNSSTLNGSLWFYRDKKMFLWKDGKYHEYDNYKIENGKVIASNEIETITLKIVDEKTLEYGDSLYFFEEMTEYIPKHTENTGDKPEQKSVKLGHYEAEEAYLWFVDEENLEMVPYIFQSSTVSYYYEIEGNILYATSARGTLEFEIVDEETLKLDETIFRYNEEMSNTPAVMYEGVETMTSITEMQELWGTPAFLVRKDIM